MMEAGRELDCLIAEEVMGWHRHPEHLDYPNAWFDVRDKPIDCAHGYMWLVEEHYCGQCGLIAPAFKPSTDIAAAWTVVEKLCEMESWPQVGTAGREKGVFHVCRAYSLDRDGQWFAGGTERDDEYYLFKAYAATAPHAICLAALKAVGYKEDK